MPRPAPLVLPVGATENSVRVHPVVLYMICDSYTRRSERVERVIGTLLGTVGDGIVEIRSCYAVPHSEGDDQVSLSFPILSENSFKSSSMNCVPCPSLCESLSLYLPLEITTTIKSIAFLFEFSRLLWMSCTTRQCSPCSRR